MQLPIIKTLSKYINLTAPGCGLNPDILKRRVEKLGLPNTSENEKYINLCFDKMKIKSGLTYSKTTGQIVGFTDLQKLFVLHKYKTRNSSQRSKLSIAINEASRYI